VQSKCSNCGYQISPEVRICPECAFPLTGLSSDERDYSILLLDMKSWMKEAQKAINGILSFAIIFMFFGLVVLFFSFLLHYDFYITALFYLIIAFCYLMFYFLAKKVPYKIVFLAFVFYALHTIYEFSTGMIIQDVVVQKGQNDFFSVIIKYAPFVYIIFRLMLFSGFIRGIYFILKIEKYPKMAKWLQSKKEAFV